MCSALVPNQSLQADGVQNGAPRMVTKCLCTMEWRLGWSVMASVNAVGVIGSPSAQVRPRRRENPRLAQIHIQGAVRLHQRHQIIRTFHRVIKPAEEEHVVCEHDEPHLNVSICHAAQGGVLPAGIQPTTGRVTLLHTRLSVHIMCYTPPINID